MKYQKVIVTLKKAKSTVYHQSNKPAIDRVIKAFEAFDGLPLVMYSEHRTVLARLLKEFSEFEYDYKGHDVQGRLLYHSLEI